MVITNLDYFRGGDHFPKGAGHSEFICKRRHIPFFLFKILNFNIFGDFQKEYFLCNEDFFDIF